jgi:uncharacterized protein DUF1565
MQTHRLQSDPAPRQRSRRAGPLRKAAAMHPQHDRPQGHRPRHWACHPPGRRPLVPGLRRRPEPKPGPSRAGAWLLAAVALLTTAAPARGGADHADPHAYYVSPDGSDHNAGTSPGEPFATIQKALDVAPEGSVITLAPGDYLQDVVTRRPGIVLTGPSRAVIRGSGDASRIVQVRHDDVTLQGFTIDGLVGKADDEDAYRDKGVYVMSRTPGDGVDRFRALRLTIRNLGGECMRLRYLVTRSEIAHNRIGPCGAYDFRFDGGGKNGEGIYLGTAPEQQGKNQAPDARADVSRGNHIHHNVIDTQGNECVEAKEHATGNLIEHNVCTGNRDPNAAGFASRGDSNVFRYNVTWDNAGAGLRFGGDEKTEGVGNSAYGNVVFANHTGGIKFQRAPQGAVCGNIMWSNSKGDAVGSDASGFKPVEPCW